ncbi:MAG: hypothetical protein IJZ68_04650 [Bacteroidaceae bacterium]|nr:hypothetical protein [Bacteroidaceae bacterium]
MKKSILFVALLLLTVIAYGQQMLSGNRILSSENVEVLGIQLKGNTIKLDPKTDRITLEVMDFGDLGSTYVVNMEANSVKESLGEMYNLCASWSGNNFRMMYQDGGYFVVDGKAQGFAVAFVFTNVDGKKALIVNFVNNDNAVTDIRKGMTMAELTQKTSGLQCKSEFSHKSGELDVYSFKIPSMKEVWNGHKYISQVTKKEYGQFYFDAQNKLVKWIILN